MRDHRRPLNRSITIGCVLFIIVLCILLSMANLSIYESYVYNDYREYIADILRYAMAHIDGDDLKVCVETGEESKKYKETLLFMDDLIDHFDDIHYFYAVRPLNTEATGNMMSVLSAERYYDRYVDTEGNLYLGWISDDEFDAETAAHMLAIMKGDGILRGADHDRYEELAAAFQAETDKLQADAALEPWEKVSASIGAAFYDPAVDDGPECLFRRADHVMYDRKKKMKAERRA